MSPQTKPPTTVYSVTGAQVLCYLNTSVSTAGKGSVARFSFALKYRVQFKSTGTVTHYCCVDSVLYEIVLNETLTSDYYAQSNYACVSHVGEQTAVKDDVKQAKTENSDSAVIAEHNRGRYQASADACGLQAPSHH